MKNGDIVTQIDGVVPTNPLMGVVALEELREDAHSKLTISRRGTVVELRGNR